MSRGSAFGRSCRSAWPQVSSLRPSRPAARCSSLAQVRLPDELDSLLEAAKAAWDSDDHALAARQLTDALELASQLGYA